MKVMFLTASLAGVMLVTGCATPPQNPSTLQYGATGAGLGAIAGAVAGNNIHGINSGEGAVAGAALGALIGATMGAQQDRFQTQIGAVAEQASTTLINVRNSNGSYTPVVIRRVGTQYVGPRGEFYNALPTEEQLKRPYGF